MPIYEFKCNKCRHEFEFLFRSTDTLSDVSCPKCRSKKIKKLMSAFAGGKSNCDSCTSSSCSTA